MKSEKPTPRRLLKQSQKGKSFNNKDLSATAILLAGVLALGFAVSLRAIAQLYPHFIGRRFDVPLQQAVQIALKAFAYAVAPVMLACMAATVLIGLAKSRGVLATEALKLDPTRLNPVSGFKNLFSMKVVQDVLKAVLYTIGVSIAVVVIWKSYATAVFALANVDTGQAGPIWLALGFEIAIDLLLILAPVCLLAAFLDYRLYIHGMKMEKHEVKQERKDTEGNPEIKNKRREVAQELSAQVQADVAGSSLILANPTHIAIGIYLHSEAIPLPYISVREQGERALAVIALAERLGVPVVRDIPLARAIHARNKRYEFVQSDQVDALLRLIRWLRDVERAGRDDAEPPSEPHVEPPGSL
jgi:type III secretion system export apparatus switch protein